MKSTTMSVIKEVVLPVAGFIAIVLLVLTFVQSCSRLFETKEVVESHELVALDTSVTGQISGSMIYVRGSYGSAYQCMQKMGENTYKLYEYEIDKVTLHTIDDGNYRIEVTKDVFVDIGQDYRIKSVDLYIPPDSIDMTYSAN